LIALAVAAVTALLLAWPARLDATGKTDPTMPYLPAGVIWHVPHRGGREFHWHGLDLVVGNLYVVLGLAGLAVAASALWTSRQARAVTIQTAPSSTTRPSTT
jgi:alpha-1,2-mannosyltransferase